MTKKEILLKQRNAENAPLTDYIGTDGYVWKMIENAMEEYHQAKLKLLGITIVSGTAEHHCGNKITKKELFHDCCLKCGEYFSED